MEFRKDAEGFVIPEDVLKLVESNRMHWRVKAHAATVEREMEKGKTYGEAVDIADESQLQSLFEHGDEW